MRFDTLDQVVKDAIELGGADYSHRHYGSALKVAVRVLQDLSIFSVLPNHKTVSLTVSPILTARVPKDCLRPVKVGRCQNGLLYELFYNNDICTQDKSKLHCTCSNNTPQETDDVVLDTYGGGACGYCSFYNLYSNNHPIKFQEVYTLRPYPPMVGTFKYDYENDLIQFGSGVEPGDEILLMYKTDIQFRDGAAVVPVYCFDAIMYRVKELVFSRTPSEEERNRSRYEQAYRRIRKVFNKMTAQDWEEAIGGYKYSAPKR